MSASIFRMITLTKSPHNYNRRRHSHLRYPGRPGGGGLTILAAKMMAGPMEQMNTAELLLEAEANMRKNAGDPRRGRGKQWARSRLMDLRRLEDSPRPADSGEERPAKRRRAGAAKRVTFANPLAVSAAPTVVQPPPPASPPTFEELTEILAHMSGRLDAMEQPLREAVEEAPPQTFHELGGILAHMSGRLDAMERALQEAQNEEPIDVDTVDGIPIVQSRVSITDEDAAAAVARFAAEREHEGNDAAAQQQPVDVQREVAEVLVTFDDYTFNPWLPNMRVEVVDSKGTTRGMTPHDMLAASHEMRADTVRTVLSAIRDHEIPDTDDPEAYVRQQLTNWSLETFMDDALYATRFRVALQQYMEGEHADDRDSDFEASGIFPSAATAVCDAFTADLGRAPSQPTARPDGESPSVGETANTAEEQTATQMTSGSALPLPSREILRHCPKCPCHGCTLDREDPDPFSTDPVARRKELRRRSNLHNKYRDSVGRNTMDDPGPRKYRPNRACVQQRA